MLASIENIIHAVLPIITIKHSHIRISMHMCMHVCIVVCMHACIYACMHIMHECMYICMQLTALLHESHST